MQTATTSTEPTTVASPTPTIVAVHLAHAAPPPAYAQKDRARHSAKHRSPNAITNVTTLRATSTTAEDATKRVPLPM